MVIITRSGIKDGDIHSKRVKYKGVLGIPNGYRFFSIRCTE